MKKLLFLVIALLGVEQAQCGGFKIYNNSGGLVRYTVRYVTCRTRNEGRLANRAETMVSGCRGTAFVSRVSANDPNDPSVKEGVIDGPAVVGWTPYGKLNIFTITKQRTGNLKADGTDEWEFVVKHSKQDDDLSTSSTPS